VGARGSRLVLRREVGLLTLFVAALIEARGFFCQRGLVKNKQRFV
jgi:hypothetical protein